MKVTISKGNTKLAFPNISLRPILDCHNCAECSEKCYAMKAWKQYPNVRKAWGDNSSLARTFRAEFFDEIGDYLYKYGPEFFRWHVAGDILDQDYLYRMYRLAHEFKDTKFMVFTKMFDLEYGKIPSNLSVGFSIWPTMRTLPERRKNIRFAWMQDGTETRIPHNAIECSGKCEDCLVCWSQYGADIVLPLH